MKVAAIVPAYNEERTIGAVVQALSRCALVNDIIVVSDGSEDNTAAAARQHSVKVVELEENVGKGGAMKIGTEHSDADVFLFIDADLIGLAKQHIEDLVNPVLEGKAEMTVGVFDEGRFATDLAQKIAPFLSGQRAVSRRLFQAIPEIERSRYGVEMALSRYADKNHTKVVEVQLKDLSQIMKEEKQGFFKGFCSRLKMYWEILRKVKV